MIKKKQMKPVEVLSEEDAKSYQKWQAPLMEGKAINAAEIDKRKKDKGLTVEVEEEPEIEVLPTSEELEAIRQAAYDEGFEEGRANGEKEMQTEQKKFADAVERVLASFVSPLHAFDDVAEYQLAQLALTIAKQIIRREIQTDPNQVMAVVRESVGLLPSHCQDIKVYLNPADCQLLKDNLQLSAGDNKNWELLEDPNLQRGDCRVHSGDASVFADLETRLAKISANLLGSRRSESDQESDNASD